MCGVRLAKKANRATTEKSVESTGPDEKASEASVARSYKCCTWNEYEYVHCRCYDIQRIASYNMRGCQMKG
jgi:hypothetical protein